MYLAFKGGMTPRTNDRRRGGVIPPWFAIARRGRGRRDVAPTQTRGATTFETNALPAVPLFVVARADARVAGRRPEIL